ncbi:Enoyl-CoA hydratase/isomerase [Acidithiobacillus ferrivorans]|uniref:Enoyl-CoA hydratase/isomerase n=1 Tax=Acidithiobacillus ferrivorans TaxID=160808 RepID=A0A060ULW1_9PROT|nr:crotonase/enoyl-CoA hydratase family protein [Acidithiobacillus ferrivorans]CDQ09331.1 Enoyl-CoA hydratase/isomerase [Acidithiobacillus ferrivorans]SMH63975.1 Enoyl-CoA hydratase/isomerase [Acidithiobacillus ferrivorans]
MNSMLQPSAQLPESNHSSYSQLGTFYDEKYQLMWCVMHASPRPCFTPALLDEISHFHGTVVSQSTSSEGHKISYIAWASDVPGVFNLGGDLNLFRTLIQSKDRNGLLRYTTSCIKVLHANICHFDQDITTISLVQGDALGGGFEGALSSNVLIAERSAKMGMPEILFNLFPGMGAYSLLSRKVGIANAERMILSGKIYTADELHDMGVVDILAEDNHGERAVYDYIQKENRAKNGYRALRKVKDLCSPITYEELIKVGEIWVDAALRLEARDLRMMERLVARQSARHQGAA